MIRFGKIIPPLEFTSGCAGLILFKKQENGGRIAYINQPVSRTSIRHGWNHLSGYQKITPAMVPCNLVRYKPVKWSQCSWNTAKPRYKKLYNCMVMDAQDPSGYGSPMTRRIVSNG
jgi:hypothetical protein